MNSLQGAARRRSPTRSSARPSCSRPAGTVVQETRHWDVGAKRTSTLRSKEEAHDYRYFPEPDMVPFEFSDEFIEEIRGRLPELPDAKKARFCADYGLPSHDATVLTGDLDLAEFFEAAVTLAGAERAKAISNVMLNDLSAYLNAEGIGVVDCTDRAEHGRRARRARRGRHDLEQAGQGGLRRDGRDRRRARRDRRAQGHEAGQRHRRDRGGRRPRDRRESRRRSQQYRGGKTGLIGFFVGQVMREMGGQANPKVVNEVLKTQARRLGSRAGERVPLSSDHGLHEPDHTRLSHRAVHVLHDRRWAPRASSWTAIRRIAGWTCCSGSRRESCWRRASGRFWPLRSRSRRTAAASCGCRPHSASRSAACRCGAWTRSCPTSTR